MPIAARILRAQADDHAENRLAFSGKEEARHARILKIGQELLAHHGRHEITFQSLAIALNMSTGTLRKHFPDLDSLLFTLLSDHLTAIFRKLGEVARDVPDRSAGIRAAYRAFTQSGLCAPTQAHYLLLDQRQFLPWDLRQHIEKMISMLAEDLGGEHGLVILAMLDAPATKLDVIETMIGALQSRRVPEAPRPLKPAAPEIKPFVFPKRPLDPPADYDWSGPSLRWRNGEILGARAGPAQEAGRS